MRTLSQSALDVINNFLALPIPGHPITCPYFNNKKNKVRGALRVFIGKGSAEDIVDEITLLSLREKIDLSVLSDEAVRQLLVENNIGIDCSALAYYILDAEAKARGKGGLKKYLKFPHVKSPLRKLLIKLRPVENVNVDGLAHDANSRTVSIAEVQPGDLIIMLGTGINHDLNHVLIIDQIDEDVIHYTHTLQWSTDGKYQHGVRQGVIRVVTPGQGLKEQTWTEQEKTGDDNETFWRAETATRLEIRRLRALE